MFALNRKALGRSLNKAVPVSVVGIFSYDGAQVSWGCRGGRHGLACSTPTGSPEPGGGRLDGRTAHPLGSGVTRALPSAAGPVPQDG